MAPLHVLAHEGGWDEILMVAGPVVLFAGLLLLARKRARDLTATRDDARDRTRGDGAPHRDPTHGEGAGAERAGD